MGEAVVFPSGVAGCLGRAAATGLSEFFAAAVRSAGHVSVAMAGHVSTKRRPIGTQLGGKLNASPVPGWLAHG